MSSGLEWPLGSAESVEGSLPFLTLYYSILWKNQIKREEGSIFFADPHKRHIDRP